jgi:hypothetical protein
MEGADVEPSNSKDEDNKRQSSQEIARGPMDWYLSGVAFFFFFFF